MLLYNYLYSHNFEGNFAFQEFMPSELAGTKLYDPQRKGGRNAKTIKNLVEGKIWVFV